MSTLSRICSSSDWYWTFFTSPTTSPSFQKSGMRSRSGLVVAALSVAKIWITAVFLPSPETPASLAYHSIQGSSYARAILNRARRST